MANNVSGRKCPNCGSALRYDPESSRLICDFCDSGFTIEEVDAADREQAQQVGSMNFTAGNEALQNLKAYVCSSCGAEVVADPQTVSLVCPYCGSNIVLSDKINGELCPDGIIPFAITPKALPQAVRNFYKGKKLLPRNFFSDASIGTVQGIYVPFWLYDSNPAGEMIFNGSKDRTYRDGDYVVTEHRNYELHRNVSMSFHDIPTDASERMEDALMDSLEPFDFSDIQDFAYGYLSGFVADRFDQDADYCLPRATSRIKSSVATVFTSAVRGYYATLTPSRSNIALDHTQVNYVLLPVYFITTSFRGQKYEYAVNGQTGKMVGELPVDTRRSTKYMLGIGAAVFAAALAFATFIL